MSGNSQRFENNLQKALTRFNNSIRLLVDALVLYEGERYQGALSSALHGSEEVGASIMWFRDDSWARENRGKQHLGRLREWVFVDTWRQANSSDEESLPLDRLGGQETTFEQLDWRSMTDDFDATEQEARHLDHLFRATGHSLGEGPPEWFDIELANAVGKRFSQHVVNRLALRARTAREAVLYKSWHGQEDALQSLARVQIQNLRATVLYVSDIVAPLLEEE